jgi:metal-responsive CopG/Arc/MetJ family transcriptional regulator
MSEIVRVSVSIPKSLFKRPEKLVAGSRYGNRYDFIR